VNRHRLVLAALLCGTLGAAEQAMDMATALARSPAISAARARVQAAGLAARAAGVLPDPMLGIGVGRELPRMGEAMDMYGAMIEQPLPRWGERDAMRQTALAQVAMAEAEFAELVGEHAAGVAAAGAEAQAAEQSLVLVEESRDRVRALSEVVRARVAGGGGTIGESLALDTRVQQLDLQLADLARRRADAEAEVRGRLGLPPDATLPPLSLPATAAIRPDATPMARRAAASRGEAEAMAQEAIARGNPETAVGLSWDREAVGTEEQVDKYNLTFRVSLPVWRQAYGAAADAARGRARAAAHEARASGWMARSQVGRAQRAVEQAARAQAVADGIAGRGHTEYDAVIRQVGTGNASIMTVLDLLDRISEARMQAIEARLTSQLALAQLWRLAPPTLPEAVGAASDHDHRMGTP
jgi:outer membrane protein TolC